MLICRRQKNGKLSCKKQKTSSKRRTAPASQKRRKKSSRRRRRTTSERKSYDRRANSSRRTTSASGNVKKTLRKIGAGATRKKSSKFLKMLHGDVINSAPVLRKISSLRFAHPSLAQKMQPKQTITEFDITLRKGNMPRQAKYEEESDSSSNSDSDSDFNSDSDDDNTSSSSDDDEYDNM